MKRMMEADVTEVRKTPGEISATGIWWEMELTQ